MKEDSSKKPQFSEAQIRQVLGSPEGKQVIAVLSRSPGNELQEAAQEFRKGNVARAQQILAPLAGTPEAVELLNKINRK